ncbi:MAG: hypothetical protein WBF54_15340 [Terriglobales bacterium]
MTTPSASSAPEKPHCHARRHMTPSQFMTYDAMKAMAKKPPFPARPGAIIHVDFVCYGQLITITNRTSIGKNQNRDNIKALVKMGWLIPIEEEGKPRWKSGRWANNKYIVLDHEQYERRALRHEDGYVRCPGFKFNEMTGENLTPLTDKKRTEFSRSDFVINAAFKRHDERMKKATTEELAAWAEWLRNADPKHPRGGR